MQVSTIRPGYLVSLKTSLRGNVSYIVRDLEGNAPIPPYENAATKIWETTRTTADVVEYNAAIVARSKARSCILKHCVASGFGYLCPEGKRDDLGKGIAEARDVAAKFNATARVTRIMVNTLVGRVASDDAEAVRAINSEVRDLLANMARGVETLSPKMIREAANKATQLAKMLSPDAGARAREAINAAREAASKIKEAGEQAAVEIDRQTLRKLAEVRTAFLDLDDAGEIAEPIADGRGVDLEPEAREPEDCAEDPPYEQINSDGVTAAQVRAIDWE